MDFISLQVTRRWPRITAFVAGKFWQLPPFSRPDWIQQTAGEIYKDIIAGAVIPAR